MDENEVKCLDPCSQCSEELTDSHSFLDSIYKDIIEWLCANTCIDWHQYARGGKQDCSIYGTVFISNSENLGDKSEDLACYSKGEGEDKEFKTCRVVSGSVRLTVELGIYELARANKDCEGGYEYQETLSPADVIHQIDDFFLMQGIERAGVTRIKNITNGFDHKNNWRRSAFGEFEMKVCRKVSYHQNNECLTVCVEDCEGNPLCIPKKECEE